MQEKTIRLSVNIAENRDIIDDFIEKIIDIIDVNINIDWNNNTVYVSSDSQEGFDRALEVLNSVTDYLNNDKLDINQLDELMELLKQEAIRASEEEKQAIYFSFKGKTLKTKSIGQALYVNSILKNNITFSIGPAGTGKTYLSVAMAVSFLKSKKVEKIILTKPAVEAGERLGFLPGDIAEKVNPYLRPVYDVLEEFLGYESYQKLIEKGIIEVAPLAFMRGRSLNNAFIILDEAQNTTKEQMKMFLTRTGMGSKVVVNGDLTQIDLPYDKESGLKHSTRLLKDVEGIGIINLSKKDAVRSPIVQSIIAAYEKENDDKSFKSIL